MSYKLKIHLIPEAAFGQNMRSVMTQYEWSQLSSFIREDCVCAGCLKKYPKKFLDAHEEWEFKNGKQKLRHIVPLCKKCHEAVHIGRATAKGTLDEACERIMKYRNISEKKFEKEYNQAWALWNTRSLYHWKLVTTKEKAWEIAKKDKEEFHNQIEKMTIKESKKYKKEQKKLSKTVGSI